MPTISLHWNVRMLPLCWRQSSNNYSVRFCTNSTRQGLCAIPIYSLWSFTRKDTSERIKLLLHTLLAASLLYKFLSMAMSFVWRNIAEPSEMRCMQIKVTVELSRSRPKNVLKPNLLRRNIKNGLRNFPFSFLLWLPQTAIKKKKKKWTAVRYISYWIWASRRLDNRKNSPIE